MLSAWKRGEIAKFFSVADGARVRCGKGLGIAGEAACSGLRHGDKVGALRAGRDAPDGEDLPMRMPLLAIAVLLSGSVTALADDMPQPDAAPAPTGPVK